MSHRRAARFLFTMTAAVSSGLLAATLAAAPALADAPGGGGGAGCTGQSCWVSMESQYIHLSGDYTMAPTGFANVAVPAPPCWMTPLISGPEMYALYEASKNQQVGPSGQNSWAGYAQWIAQIKQEKNSPGEWYVPEMYGTAAGFACGAKLPLLEWVPPGTAPQAPPIPMSTLAAYAYDHLKVPTPHLVVNPAAKNFVSLPTYVWATAAGGGNMPARLTITASSGGNSATLIATPGQLSVSASQPAAYSSGCTASGSKYPIGHAPANSGPGVIPDCGVVFTAPSKAATIQGSLTWDIAPPPGTGPFAPITVGGTRTVSVAEIQNLNG
ncbi:MAG TPA: hypothetical protein VGL63_03655 [Streptosporangiaceae bacterium]|jgi:hypothetical protein